MRTHAKYLIASAVALAVLTAPLAFGAGEGRPLDGGARNPSSNEALELTRETEIIANTATYATRQSNKSTSGGGAVYGCRSRAGGTAGNNEPCVRAVNLSNGRAFEFDSGGAEVGRIEANDPAAKPFTTNATGVADGLNADRVDGLNAPEIVASAQAQNRFASVAASGTLQGGRGATTANRVGAGNYSVTFNADITNCAYSGTQVRFDEDNGATAVERTDATTLRVRTRAGGGTDGLGATAPADKPFHVTVIC